MRRVRVNGFATLMDYCTPPSFASGGFIADSEFDGGTIVNGSQQQWLVRNSKLDGWTKRRLEPGVLWGHRRTRAVLPQSCVMRWTLHDTRNQSCNTRSAVPVHGL